MTPADWLTGAPVTAVLALSVVRQIRTSENRRARDRRELRRSAARGEGGAK